MSALRGIVLRAHEVRGIIDGRQSQLRRVVLHRHAFQTFNSGPDGGKVHHGPAVIQRRERRDAIEWLQQHCPFAKIGERLWVKESFGVLTGNGRRIVYAADGEATRRDGSIVENMKWGSARRMERWASRLTLEVTGIRVEQMQSISEVDALAEGVERCPAPNSCDGVCGHEKTAREGFELLTESVHGVELWRSNPWVWAIGFRLQPPVHRRQA